MPGWNEEWARWVQGCFSNLRQGGFKLTSVESVEYNCIAWAAKDSTRWWWPSVEGYWPENLPLVETLENFISVFSQLGYQPSNFDETLEPVFEKVAIYARADGRPTHMARQTETGAWTSKLGEGCDIEHDTLGGLEGTAYGRAVQILKRPISRENGIADITP